MEKYIGEIVAAAVALGAVLIVAYHAARVEVDRRAKAIYAISAAVVAALLVGLAEAL